MLAEREFVDGMLLCPSNRREAGAVMSDTCDDKKQNQGSPSCFTEDAREAQAVCQEVEHKKNTEDKTTSESPHLGE